MSSCKNGCGSCSCGNNNVWKADDPNVVKDPLKERAEKLGVPLIPKRPTPITPTPGDPNPIVAVCGECGLDLRAVMGYVCSHSNCPCFARVTC